MPRRDHDVPAGVAAPLPVQGGQAEANRDEGMEEVKVHQVGVMRVGTVADEDCMQCGGKKWIEIDDCSYQIILINQSKIYVKINSFCQFYYIIIKS